MIGRAIAGSAPRSEGLALYGRALYVSGRHAEAERVLREAVSTSPVDPEAFEFLADAAESLRHDLLARDALMNLDVLQGDLATAETRARRAQADRRAVPARRGRDHRRTSARPRGRRRSDHRRRCWVFWHMLGGLPVMRRAPGSCWTVRLPPRRAIRARLRASSQMIRESRRTV